MGDRFHDLVRFLGRGAKVAIISNALDGIPAKVRQEYRGFSATEFFREHGLDAFDVDLRDFFHAPTAKSLSDAVSDARLIWAVGGNAFILRRAMRQSGLDDFIIRHVTNGTLVYGGWSAGACVAGSSLRGIDLMDDPQLTPSGYDSEVIWEGLGLVDFIIVPHFASRHPESASAQQAAHWLKESGLPFQTIRDGEVIVR